MILINTFLPVDVIRAGLSIDRREMDLSMFRPRDKRKKLWYRIVDAYNGTKITLDYNIEYEYFSVRVSLPKLAYGTNAINLPVSYAEELIELMNFHLSEIGYHLDFGEFKVSSLEISHNYVCETIEDKEKYIEHFSNKNVSRKIKKLYKGSVVFENKTNKTTIYDKKAEVKNDDDIPVNKSVLDRTLRVEHKLFKRGVKKHFKDRSVKNILLSNTLEEIFLSENKSAGLHLKALHKSLFYKILMCNLENKRTSYKKRVLKFYQELNQLGEQYVKERYSTHQIKTYKKIMESAGYSTTYISKSVHIVDFMNLEEKKTVRTNKEERKMIMEKVKKEKKTFVVKVKEFLSLCLPCNFFKKAFDWFDTS